MAGQRTFGPERDCTRCGKRHTRRHCWCLGCQREATAIRRQTGSTKRGRVAERDCSTAPAPPPGFTKRDLHAGKPYDSAYTRDDEWLDGDRPGGSHVQTLGAI